MAFDRPRVLQRNVPESTTVDAGIRVAVADDVKSVECVKAEADRVSFEKVEVLECGQIHVQITGAAYCPVM